MNDQPKSGFLAWFDSIEKIAVSLAAVVALIGAIVALVYKLWPDPTPPPPSQKAALEIRDSFPARFVDFLAETGQDTSTYTNAELNQAGIEYYVDVMVTGLRNKNTEIAWTLRGDLGDLSNDERRKWIHQLLGNVKPPTDNYTRTAKVWIQTPPFRGRFFAEIEIDYPEYETLVVIKTRPFSGKETQPREQAVSTTETVTTTPATTTEAVTTYETTTAAVTTYQTTTTAVITLADGTTTTTTDTVPTTSTVTVTTTATATVPITIPATTSTITRTTPTPGPAQVPQLRPPARIASQ